MTSLDRRFDSIPLWAPLASLLLALAWLIPNTSQPWVAFQKEFWAGVTFALVGTIYKSTSHPDVKPAGVKLIEDITRDSSFPVLAIGGITADKVEEVIKAGAAGVACISAIAGAEDMKAAAEELSKALKEAWEARLSAGTTTASA